MKYKAKDGCVIAKILTANERGFALEYPDDTQRISADDNFEGIVVDSGCSILVGSKIQFVGCMPLDLANLCIVDQRDILCYWEN